MSHMGVEDGHQTAEEYRWSFKAECPETIYLLKDSEGIVWCDDPDPAGMGVSDAPWSMAYIRRDVADKRCDEMAASIGQAEAENHVLRLGGHGWTSPAQDWPERGQLCLFLVVTEVPFVVAGYIQEAEDETPFELCSIRDQYGEPIGYEADAIEYWKPLQLPAAVSDLPEVL